MTKQWQVGKSTKTVTPSKSAAMSQRVTCPPTGYDGLIPVSHKQYVCWSPRDELQSVYGHQELRTRSANTDGTQECCWSSSYVAEVSCCWKNHHCFPLHGVSQGMRDKPCGFRAVCPELHEGVPPDGMNLSGSGLTSFSSAYSSSTLSPWKPLGGCTTSTLF